MSLEKELSPQIFNHIYIEKEALGYRRTEMILDKLPSSSRIIIDDYKDYFSRPNQDYYFQKKTSRSLILAKKKANFLYEGSSLCQSFGFNNFYYSSTVMNCIYDCDYCYLKGMYGTGSIVVFVNEEDLKNEIEMLLSKNGSVYLCISFDTDLMALEKIVGLCEFYIELAKAYTNLTIEIRTKSSPMSFSSSPNIYYAFSLSPEPIISQYEHGTSSLNGRIRAINQALLQGANVRLIFDPLIYDRDFKSIYRSFYETVSLSVDMTRIKDFGVGTFRIPKEYLGKLRKNSSYSKCTMYPFVNDNGNMVYDESIRNQMEQFMLELIKEDVDEHRIYRI